MVSGGFLCVFTAQKRFGCLRNTLPHQLQECFPELDPKNGPHAIFEQPFERDRAESSCICPSKSSIQCRTSADFDGFQPISNPFGLLEA